MVIFVNIFFEKCFTYSSNWCIIISILYFGGKILKGLLKFLTVNCLLTTALLARELTILHTNDIHAHVNPFLFRGLDPEREVGGFANITTYVKQVRAEEEGKRDVLFVDAGDFFTGPYISSLTNGEAIVDTLNTMGYDAASIGNHEFDHGWRDAQEKLSKIKFPLLLGNVFEEETGKPFWNTPYTIIDKDGFKIGIIGLHGQFAFYDTVAAITREGLEARDEEEYLKKYIAELEDKVDMIMLLIHEGVPARQSSFGGEDVERLLKKDIELATNVPGVDILVTGHAHQGTPKPIKVGDTLIVSTFAQGAQVGRLDITFDEKEKKITKYNGELVTIYADELERDPETQKVIDDWMAKVETITSKVVGTTDKTLTRSYGTESLLGNLFADSLMEAAIPFNAEFAVTNSGGIRNDIEKGEITFGDIMSAAPFPNALVVLDLKGKDIISIFEHAAGLTNGVLQVSSQIRMTYDPSKEVGSRLVKLTFNGENIDPERTYRVATVDFLANGGDGFSGFLNGTNRVEKGGYMVYSAVQDYVLKHKNISPKLEDRVITVE